jgi:glucose-1-phosphate cytidylyltransferase
MGAVGYQQLRINGGFFALRREIFTYMRKGEELVEEPFGRLIARANWSHPLGWLLAVHGHLDKIAYDRMEARGSALAGLGGKGR